MSLVYSDTQNYSGIIQRIEKMLGKDYGYISGNTKRLKEWTATLNLVHDEVLGLIFNEAGNSSWNFDDSNHEKYPIIKIDLVSGQRDYPYTKDEQGNLILDFYRVLCKDENGVYQDLHPMNQQEPRSDTKGFVDGQNLTGTPTRYDKTANGIFLDLIPNYSSDEGIKAFINREGSYFSTSDTTKKPGIVGLYHEYYPVAAVLREAVIYSLKNKDDLMQEKLVLRQGIMEHYGKRVRDEDHKMVALVENTR